MEHKDGLDGKEVAELHPQSHTGKEGPGNQEQLLRFPLRYLHGLCLQTPQKRPGRWNNSKLEICSTEPGGPGHPWGKPLRVSLPRRKSGKEVAQEALPTGHEDSQEKKPPGMGSREAKGGECVARAPKATEKPEETNTKVTQLNDEINPKILLCSQLAKIN